MPSTPSSLGPYEIIDTLGAGGMGQVYRARDPRLQRTVAIKILLDTGALTPERQRRFAREAIAASALNHPNIITVYDVGVEGDTPYLVSELIEGTSLRAEMSRGRVPLKRAVEIVSQIADGLAAAHEAGIVHRDLKPENVMLTVDDRVKIVDFGLARTDASDDGALGMTTDTQTADGLIVGTVPYMSPEQARGSRADFRSDQFAVGVMLFEMITATHPFRRDTAVQTLSAIIADDPPDLAQLAPSVPLSVRVLLRRLLAKNPRERFAHTADLAADLRGLRELVSETVATAAVPAAATGPRVWPWRVAGALAVVAVAVVAGTLTAPAETGASFEKLTPLATDAGYQGVASWSPDGKTIAYEAEIDGVVQIFTRTPGSPMRTQVTKAAFDCFSPFWSHDGRHIYYHSLARDSDALWRVSPAGGAPEVVIEGAARAHVSPDGRTAVFLRQEPLSTDMTLWTVALPDGEPERYAKEPLRGQSFSGGHLRFSPDGTQVLAWLGPRMVTNVAGFWLLPVRDGDPRSVLTSGMSPGIVPPTFSWLPDGRHIVLSLNAGSTPGVHLFLADLSTGGLMPLTTTTLNEAAPSTSPDGRMVAFDSQATDFDLVEIPVDGSPMRPFLSSTRNEYDPATSPVSTQFAYVTDRSGSLQIWLQNEEGYLQQPLVTAADFGGGQSLAVGALAFSPDGKRLAFQRADDVADQDSAGGSRLWISSMAGGTPVRLGGADTFQDAPTWSPDGEWIAYLAAKSGDVSLLKVRVGGGSDPVVLATDIPPFLARPRWSPDGRSILCETAEGLMVLSPDGSGGRAIADTGWLAYAWDTDSTRIYGLRPTADQHHVEFVLLDARTGAERVLNPNLGTIPQALQPIRGFSRLRSGGFLTSIARVRSDIYLMEGIRLPEGLWSRLWSRGRSR